MRNLKQSYKNIKDNNKKTSTGRGRITWDWYETMEDIFKEDRTINVGATLSSMTNINEVNNIEEGFISIPSDESTSVETSEHTMNLDTRSEITENLSEIQNLSESTNSVRCVKDFIRGNAYISNWLKNCVQFNPYLYDILESSNNFDENVIANVKLREQFFMSYSPVPDVVSNPSTNVKEKAAKSRAMYSLRKKILDCEERRVQAINKLIEKIDENNKIQKERNEIFKRLVPSYNDRTQEK